MNNDELPTNPGTPTAKLRTHALHITPPASDRLSSGELRDFITVFRTLGDDIQILEKEHEDFKKVQSQQSYQIQELQRVYANLDRLCSGFEGQLGEFKTAVLREVRSIKGV